MGCENRRLESGLMCRNNERMEACVAYLGQTCRRSIVPGWPSPGVFGRVLNGSTPSSTPEEGFVVQGYS